MEIAVLVKTKQKENRIKYIEEENIFLISTKQEGRDNKANLSIIDMVSKYFKVAKGSITIKNGLKSRQKRLVIKDLP